MLTIFLLKTNSQQLFSGGNIVKKLLEKNFVLPMKTCKKHPQKRFCEKFLWQVFVISFSDKFFWQVFLTNFSENVFWPLFYTQTYKIRENNMFVYYHSFLKHVIY